MLEYKHTKHIIYTDTTNRDIILQEYNVNAFVIHVVVGVLTHNVVQQYLSSSVKQKNLKHFIVIF